MVAAKKRGKKDDDREGSLKRALGQIEKQYGAGAIMSLGKATALDVPGITTGSLSLDLALGGRGIPRGRITEVFGPEASGKTTLCLHVIAIHLDVCSCSHLAALHQHCNTSSRAVLCRGHHPVPNCMAAYCSRLPVTEPVAHEPSQMHASGGQLTL